MLRPFRPSASVRWLFVALAALSPQAIAKPPSGGGGGGESSGGKAAFIAGDVRGGKGGSGYVDATSTGNSPWVMYTTDLNARRLSWKDATANLTQLGTGRVRDFQLDSTSLSAGWVLTEKHLSRNTALTSGGSWSVVFDSNRFSQQTGVTPASFRMLQIQAHRAKPGYLLLLVEVPDSLYLLRTSDGGANWSHLAFAGSTGTETYLRAGNMDACQKNDDTYVTALFNRAEEEIVLLYAIRDGDAGLAVEAVREVPAAFGPQLTLGTVDNGAACDVYLEAQASLIKSADGGANWAQVGGGLEPFYQVGTGGYAGTTQVHERIQGLPDNALSVFAMVLGDPSASAGELLLARSSDGFAGHQQLNPASGGGQLRQAAFSYGSQVVYANFSTVAFLRDEGASMVYASTDNGGSWKDKSANLKSAVCSRYIQVDRGGYTCFQVFPVSVRVQP